MKCHKEQAWWYRSSKNVLPEHKIGNFVYKKTIGIGHLVKLF